MAKAENKKTQKIYKPPSNMAFMVMEDQADYSVPCPKCGKRAIDVSEQQEQILLLRHKCPHCRRLVVTPLVTEKHSTKDFKPQ